MNELLNYISVDGGLTKQDRCLRDAGAIPITPMDLAGTMDPARNGS
jgi:hypothetical protein